MGVADQCHIGHHSHVGLRNTSDSMADDVLHNKVYEPGKGNDSYKLDQSKRYQPSG